MLQEKAISLPFSIDSFGMIGTTSEQSKIWADRVRSVIGTSLRERVMRPTFGTLVPFSLFNNVENASYEIQDEVSRAFGKQLSLLSLQSTDVEQGTSDSSLKVTITYALPNQEVNKTVIGFVSIRGTLPIYEELT